MQIGGFVQIAAARRQVAQGVEGALFPALFARGAPLDERLLEEGFGLPGVAHRQIEIPQTAQDKPLATVETGAAENSQSFVVSGERLLEFAHISEIDREVVKRSGV